MLLVHAPSPAEIAGAQIYFIVSVNLIFPTENTALFSNDSGLATSNIVGRVTGGQTSNIFGTIQTATNFGAANLFLMNPAGWIFGRTAALNVGGSFYATTADYVKLGTDGVLFADPAKASALTSAPPSAFGFLTSNPGAIDVQTGTGSFATRLQVPNGKSFSLVGGPVSVGAPSGQPPAGFILAQGQSGQGGVVNLASVASPGEATIGTAINVDSFAKLGDIQIKGGALIDAREINIRGGQLQITDATLFPGLLFSSTLARRSCSSWWPGKHQGQRCPHYHRRRVVYCACSSGYPRRSTGPSFSATPVAGDAPGINIEAGSFSMSGRAGIVANRFGPGNGANVVIKANAIEVRKGSSIALSNSFGGGDFPHCRWLTHDSRQQYDARLGRQARALPQSAQQATFIRRTGKGQLSSRRFFSLPIVLRSQLTSQATSWFSITRG